MPLTAIFEGEAVVSCLSSDEEWERMVKATHQDRQALLLGYSNLPCFPRTSSRGLRHFVLYPGQRPPGCTASETPEHLRIKALIVNAASELGWEARTEVPAPGGSWVADTLLVKGNRRIVIEVQWSRQSPEEYQRRQRRYEDHGIQCVWLHRHNIDDQSKPHYKIPLFQIAVNKDTEAVTVSTPGRSDSWPKQSRMVPIREFVQALLAYRIVTPSETRLYLWSGQCVSCRQAITYWSTRGPLGEGPRVQGYSIKEDSSRTLRIRQALDQIKAVKTPLARLAILRESQERNGGATYPAFHCSSCGELQGNATLISKCRLSSYDLEVPIDVSSKFDQRSIYLTNEEASVLKQEIGIAREILTPRRTPSPADSAGEELSLPTPTAQ